MNQAWHPGAPPALPARLGPFNATAVLGEGGSGVVYAARWGHREVALKVLRPQVAATERDRQRFLAEARLLAEIDHPSVVKVLHVGTLPDGRPYLAMEKLEGETLAQRLGRGALYQGEALALFAQLCDAVGALHGRGLVHRDLKPENVFLTGGGRYAVLLDFGIAKELDAPASTVTQDGGVRGTPAYMAPERFFGQPAGPRSDIYELAVVLYAMIVGRLPWNDVADPEARLNPARPSNLGVALAPTLEVELLRALSTRPEARPPTPAAFLAAIDQALRAGGGAPVRRTADLGGPREAEVLRAAAVAAPVATPPSPYPQPQYPYGGAGLPTSSPTAAATPSAMRARQPRWPWLVLLGAVAALAALIIFVVSAGDGDEGESTGGSSSESTASADGPDVEPAAAPADPLPSAAWTDGDSPPATAVAALPVAPAGGATDAARHFPADVTLLITVRVRDLLASKAFGPVLRDQQQNPDLAPVIMVGRMCKVDPFADIDWIAVGLLGEDADDLDVVISGDLDRKAVDRCARNLSDSASMVWIDERTLFFTTRPKVPDGWLAARGAGRDSLAAAAAPVLARTDRGATIWLAGDPQQAFGPPEPDALPPPRQVSAGARLGNELAIDARLRYASAAEAARAVKMAEDELDGIGAMLGDPRFERSGADVHFTARLDAMMTALIGQAMREAAGPDSP